MNFALIFCTAIFLDNIFGDSVRFTHPVILIGRLITFLEKYFFTKHNFINGFLICIFTISISGLTAGIFLYIMPVKLRFSGQIFLLYSAIAWRDLKSETLPIYISLSKNDLINARKFLSRVVGRDTQNLNQTEISRAAIETISENSVDGIFSVMFWALIGHFLNSDYGAYIFVWVFKASSTLDSMIGYEKYKSFGFTSAKLDDILNFLPARIGGVIIILAGKFFSEDYNFKNAFKIFMRDRKKHKSPNSAHGESAFSAVLNIRLGGGAFYNGIFQPRPFLGNENFKEPESFDIIRAHLLLDISCSIFAIYVILLSCLVINIF